MVAVEAGLEKSYVGGAYGVRGAFRDLGGRGTAVDAVEGWEAGVDEEGGLLGVRGRELEWMRRWRWEVRGVRGRVSILFKKRRLVFGFQIR